MICLASFQIVNAQRKVNLTNHRIKRANMIMVSTFFVLILRVIVNVNTMFQPCVSNILGL